MTQDSSFRDGECTVVTATMDERHFCSLPARCYAPESMEEHHRHVLRTGERGHCHAEGARGVEEV